MRNIILFLLLCIFSSNAYAASSSNILSGLFVDPRNYGAKCTGFFKIKTSEIDSNGSGYAVGDMFNVGVFLQGTQYATGHVTSVNGSGAVLGYTLDTFGGGYVYPGATASTTATSGNGTGLTIKIDTAGSTEFPTVTIANGGTGFGNGDYFAIPNATTGNYATAHVTSNSGGVVTGIALDSPGGSYAIASGVPVIVLGAGGAGSVESNGKGLTVNITASTSDNGWDDTYGLEQASIIATDTNKGAGAIQMPNGCFGANIKPRIGTTYFGEGWATDYGYEQGPQHPSLPKLFGNVSGATIMDFNAKNNVAYVGFEVNGFTAGGNTCIGSSQGGGFGPKIFVEYMSAKGCDIGFGNPGGFGGEIFSIVENSDFSANNYGMRGQFSDLYAIGNTFTSGNIGIQFEPGPGGFFRVMNSRFEYMNYGIIDNGAAVESIISGNQFDHLGFCSMCENGGWQSLNVIGNIFKQGGMAGSLKVTGTANSGGLIKLTVNGPYVDLYAQQVTSGLVDGDTILVENVGGTTEANGIWTLTVNDGTHITLQGSTYTHAYTSGGTGQVKGKSSNITFNGSNGRQFHATGNEFVTAGNQGESVVGPAYILEVVNSGSNNDWLSFLGGQAVDASANNGLPEGAYTIAFQHFWDTAPPHYCIANVAGTADFCNDHSTLSVNQYGGVGIGTTAPTVGTALDMLSENTQETSSFGLPGGTQANRPATPVTGMMRFNSDQNGVEVYFNSTWNVFKGAPIIPGYIGGLTLSNDGVSPDTVIDIASGGAADDAATVTMVFPTAYTKALTSWTLGSTGGCLDTGSIANSTWYHVFLIERVDTAVTDILCSTSPTTPTLPTNYTTKRRIGSVKTDGSAHIIPFTQIGAVFWWTTPTLDVNTSSLSTSAALQTLNVPPGVKVSPICRYTMSKDGNSVILTSGDEADIAPTTANPIAAAPGADTIDTTIAAGVVNTACPVMTTNTSQQIRARASASSTTLSIVTRGYVD